jgi:hypothetical protein
MAWTTFPTLTDGQILTGAHMQLIRDNFAETAAAKATTAGSVFVGTSANALAERIPARQTISTLQTTTSLTFTDLATVGPAVTATTGPSALVFMSSNISNSVAGGGGLMSVAVTGASAVSPSDDRGLRFISDVAGMVNRATCVHHQISLTGGSNTFTAKYEANIGGTATFQFRELGVFPL